MDNTIRDLARNITKPIVLVGMMGCGKTHVGRRLAKDLNIDFYDTDFLIEKEQNKTIPEIFKNEGEAYFRALEAKKIAQLLGGGISVISTGGGAVVKSKTLKEIKENAISIWLKADVDTIFDRVKNDQNRPLLQCENPKEQLETLLSARESLYAVADIHVENNIYSNKAVMDAIEQSLRALLKV